MTNSQENKYSMYLSVQEVCNRFSTVWNGLPAFADNYNEFTAKLSELGDIIQQQREAIKGVTRDKHNAQLAMVKKAVEIGKAIAAYASVINNQTLFENIKCSESGLMNERDSLVLSQCEYIMEKANLHANDVTDYGIDSADLTDFQNLIDAYADMITLPLGAVGLRKQATRDLKKVMAKADKILKQRLDFLIVGFEETAADFYKQYVNSRLIKKYGKTGTILRGTITDIVTEATLAGVKVEVVEQERFTETNKNGFYQFDRLKSGKYTLKFSRAGYKDEIIQHFEIIQGKMQGSDAKLERDIRHLPPPPQMGLPGS